MFAPTPRSAHLSIRTEIRELAQPLLQKLGHLTGETAHLALPCDDRSLIVSVYDSPHPLRAASSPGTLTDLYTSSTGKVFLAFLHADRIAAILALHPPPASTSRSLTTLAQLTAETERVHAQGYAIDDEEFHPGVRCVAAPVTGHGGQVVAALGITVGEDTGYQFQPEQSTSALICHHPQAKYFIAKKPRQMRAEAEAASGGGS